MSSNRSLEEKQRMTTFLTHIVERKKQFKITMVLNKHYYIIYCIKHNKWH